MKGPKYYVADILMDVSMNEMKGMAQLICAGNRPSAGKEKDDFIVVRTSSNVGDHWAWQQMSLYIEIYVRNLQNGLPNIPKLQKIQNKVLEKFPIVRMDKQYPLVWRWKASHPTFQISGDDQLGFSVWLLRSSLQINTTDRYIWTDES